MAYFVYYSDDWADMGGVGFAEFETEEKALAFILERMHGGGRARNANADASNLLECYKLIEGEQLTIKIAQTATKLVVE